MLKKIKTLKLSTISETRFLPFLGCQCLNRFQVEIVVKMQVVQILTMNQQIQHVITLTAHLQPCFNPVQCGCLKELGGLE